MRIKINILLVLVTVCLSCEKDDLETTVIQESVEENNTKQLYQDDAIILGKKLQNPYSVKNMTQAYNNLDANLRIADNAPRTTHYYVKFDPRTEEKLDLLEDDESLELFSYPLNYELLPGGSYYHDPEVPSDQVTYQYATVPVNYNFPDVPYDILEELYLPEESTGTNARYMSFVDALENEALRITGNLDETSKSSVIAKMDRWNPDGYVRVWDNTFRVDKYIPVEGVKVRARRWHRVKIAYTNANGYFKTGPFKRKANYSIKWERKHFSIRSGSFGQAVFNGPKKRERWDVYLGNSDNDVVLDKQQSYATIHSAAYDYYYKDRFGLSSPPRNSLFQPQVKIAAKLDSEKRSHAALYARTAGILPSIYIRGTRWRSSSIYATTIHELAHAAHWDMDRGVFISLTTNAYLNTFMSKKQRESFNRVLESWPEAVEWVFTNRKYQTLTNNPEYSFRLGRQTKTIQEEPVYTSVAIDLIDALNQRSRGADLPLDRVSGYTILQIEQGLKGAKSWNQWQNNMISRHTNPTENYVQELFGNWGEGYLTGLEDQYLVGDWNGDGKNNIAVRRGNEIVMDYNFDSTRDASFIYGSGNDEDEYLVGDWDGDGIDNIAVRRGREIVMDYNFDSTRDASFSFGSGNDEDEYLVGDWDGDGRDNIAVRRGREIIMDYNFDGTRDASFIYGSGNNEDEYLVGDWDGDGKDNIAVRRGREIIMDYNFDDTRDASFNFGSGNDGEDEYLVGDWGGDSRDNIAVRRGNEIIIDYNFDSFRDASFNFGNGTTDF